MYEIVTDFERPDSELVVRASKTFFVITGGIAGPRQVMHATIKPLVSDWRICGPAFTVRPEYVGDVTMGFLANFYVKPGDVVIVDAGGQTGSACWGATMARGAKQADAAGIVLDGACESRESIVNREKIPVFCRGTVAHVVSQERPGWLNCPVICGGVIVNPGDIVIGDADGVVVLPKARAADIVAESEERGSKYRGPNSVVSASYRETNSGIVDRVRAMPNVSWK